MRNLVWVHVFTSSIVFYNTTQLSLTKGNRKLETILTSRPHPSSKFHPDFDKVHELRTHWTLAGLFFVGFFVEARN